MRSKIRCIIILNYYVLEGFLLMNTNATIDKKMSIKLRIFIMGVFALTFIGIVLRTFSLIFFYDSYIGYFATGALFPTLTNIFLFISTIGILVFAFLIPKETICVSGCEVNLSLKISSVICAITSLIVLPLHLANWIDSPSFFSSYLIPLLLLVAIVYFLLNLINSKPEIKALGALALVLLFVAYLAISYFDVFVQMNSPTKIMMHISCLALMLFFMSEARCIAGAMRKKLYIFSAAIAIFFASVEAIPSIIAVIFNKIENTDYLSYDIFLCPIIFYLIVRASVIMRSPTKTEESDDTGNATEDSNAQTDDDNTETTDLQEGI